MLAGCGGNKTLASDKGAKLKIVTTIKPISMLVSAVVGDKAEIIQLIPDNASPHRYSLKPSDIKKLKQADLIFRIDDTFEVLLNKVFDNYATENLYPVSKFDGLHLLQVVRKPNNINFKEYKTNDLHLWTSPKNAKQIVNRIADLLMQSDPLYAAEYKANRDAFIQNLNVESEKLKAVLKKHAEKKYIVFHNSWQYFAESYGLQMPIFINTQEGIMSGAKTIRTIKNRIKEERIGCIFTDINVNYSILETVREGSEINHAEIDVLASRLSIDKYTYIKWLQNMGSTVDTCFSE